MCFKKLKSHSSISNRIFLFATILFISLTPAVHASLPTDPPAASAPASAEGVLDEIQISASDLKARGWAGAGDSANPVMGIRLLVDGVEIYSGSFVKQPRPDVAQAKGRSDWLESGLLLQTPLKNPVPEGPRKFTAMALLKNGEHFDLRVPEESVTLGLATPAAQPSLLGNLDEVSSNSGQKPQVIILKSGEETLYRGGFQIEERPDVATALGKPDLVNSGWIVRLDWSGKPAPSFITANFEMETGEILSLPLPITAQAQSAHPAPPAPSEALMGTRLAWLAAFLLAGGLGVVVYRAYQRRGNSSQPHDLVSPPLRITDWPTFFILAGVFFSIFASKLFLIANFGSAIPFWDQWDGEARNLLIPFLEGRYHLPDLFSPHNEHRIALTRLLVLGLFILNGQWDPLVSMVAQAALHAGILAFLVAAVRCGMGSRSWGLFATLTALFYAVPFSWNNTLWGFQSQFYFVLLTGLLGLWLTWRFADLSGGWWLGWAMLLLGLFAMGSGLLAPAVALGVGVVRLVAGLAPRRRGWIGLVAILLVVLLAVRLLVNHPGHEPLKAQNISNFLGFFFKLSAWPTEIPWLGLVLHLPVLATGVFVLVRRPPRHDPAWLVAALGAWSVLAMAALAYGRANSALDSRYTDSLAFGLLTSLACALYLTTLLGGNSRKIAQAAVAVGVAIAAAGIFHVFSDDLLSEIPERKALEPIQKNHLLAFFATNDLQALENKPHLHIPYPSATILAQVLRQKSLQEIFPAAIHQGLTPARAIFSEKAFVANGGVYQTTQPVNPKPHFGSFTQAGDASIGQLRLEYPAAPAASRFLLLVSGYPLQDGMELFLETENGKKIPIRVNENPKETWHEVIFKNPGVPFSLVAVDGSPTAWLAIGLPTPIGRLTVFTQWILKYWWIFAGLGLGCLAAAFLINYKGHNKNYELTLLFLFAVAVYYKAPGQFINPQFWAEDGWIFFTESLQHGFRSLFLPYAGYLHLIPRLCAYVCSFFPILYTPFIYVYFTYSVILLLAWSCFQLFRPLILKVFIVFSFVLVPNNVEVFLSLTNLQWIIAPFILMAFFCTPPEAAIPRTLISVGLFLVCLTGPFSVLFLPFAVATFFINKVSYYKVCNLCIIAFCAIIQISILLGSSRLQKSFPSLDFFLEIVFAKFLGSILLGNYLSLTAPAISYLVGIVFIGWVFICTAQLHKNEFVIAACLLVLSFILIFLGVLAEGHPDMSPFKNGSRYFYLPTLFLIWVIGLIIFKIPRMRSIGIVWAGLIAFSAIGSYSTPLFTDYKWHQTIKDPNRGAIFPVNPPGARPIIILLNEK